MKFFLMMIPGLTLAGSITGCAGSKWVSQLIVIHNHHLDPASIVVPADTPFDLRFASYEYGRISHTVSFPTLPVAKVILPGSTRNPMSFEGISVADLDIRHTPMPPLPVGIYPFTCDCGGDDVKGEIIVGGTKAAQAAVANQPDSRKGGE